MAVLSAYGTLVFFAAPLAIAPGFLYAWVGEMGYVSRWTFVALGLGVSANLFALPLATLAQASGGPGLQAAPRRGRYGAGLRTLGALVAAGLYIGCLASLAAVKAGWRSPAA